MEQVEIAKPDGDEGGADLYALFFEERYEELLTAVEAEWERSHPEDLTGYAALAANAAARLGRSDAAIAWLARVPESDPSRLDHLLLANANVSLGRLEDARGHRSASTTATPPDNIDDADVADGLEVVIAARLHDDLGALDPLSAERLASADARGWAPDSFAAEWLFRDQDLAASIAVGEWAAKAERTWATDAQFWWAMAASAAGSGSADLVVRALGGRTGSWPTALAQEADLLLAQALAGLGDGAGAVEAASRAAKVEGPLQRRAAYSARLYSCGPADLRCQFDTLRAWWTSLQADGESDVDERALVGASLLRLGTNDTELGRIALELVGPVAPPNPLEPLTRLTSAFVALGEQRYEEALSLFAATDLPDDIPTRHGVLIGQAGALLGLNRLDEALAASVMARALRETFGDATGFAQPIAPIDLAILERTGRWEELAEAARTAISSSAPEDQRQAAHRFLVVALIELGDLQGAVEHWRSLVEEQNDADADLLARLGVANVCQLRGKLGEARTLLGDDVLEASDQVRLGRWRLCVLVAERRGDIDAAIDALRGGASLDTGMARLLAFYLAIYHPEDAEAPSLESLTEPGDQPSPTSLLVAANVRAMLEQGGVEELLDRAVALEPAAADTPLYRISAAALAANRGDEDAVRRLLGSLDDRLVSPILASAARNAPDRDTPEARRRQLEYLDATIAAARPDVQLDRVMLVSVLAQRGTILAEGGDTLAARDAVAQAKAACRTSDPPLVRVQPEFVEVLIAMREEDWPEAVKRVRSLDLDSLPGRIAAIGHTLGGLAYCSVGDLEAARRELEAAVALKPERTSLLLLGQVELALQDPASARELLLRATREPDGADGEVLTFLSHAERLLHHDTTAIERAREAIAIDEHDAGSHLALGAALASAGRWQPALLAFEQGLRLDPPRRIRQQLWLNRLVVMAHLDRYQQIVTAASSPPELDEASLALLAECHAGALDKLGRRTEAIVVLRRAATNAHLSSAMRRVLAQADDAQVRRDSWLGFWFGRGTSGGRKAVGATLVIVGAVIAVGLAVNPERVGWLSWRATGAEAALSLAIVAVLFLIPLATSLKVAGVEMAMPVAPEPALDPIDPVAISRVLDDVLRSLFDRAQRLPSAGQGASPTVTPTDAVTAAVLSGPTRTDGTLGVGFSTPGIAASPESSGR